MFKPKSRINCALGLSRRFDPHDTRSIPIHTRAITHISFFIFILTTCNNKTVWWFMAFSSRQSSRRGGKRLLSTEQRYLCLLHSEDIAQLGRSQRQWQAALQYTASFTCVLDASCNRCLRNLVRNSGSRNKQGNIDMLHRLYGMANQPSRGR